MGLTLTLFGTPRIEVDGRPLSVDTRKATALLALLAIRGDHVGRETVAGMLWPDAPTERARASLRRTLSALTSGLDGRWVRTERDVLWLDAAAPDVGCDVDVLRTATATLRVHGSEHDAGGGPCPRCRAALDAAAAAYRGPLLEGFTLRDAPAFEEWVQLEAEGLRRDAGIALERLAELQLAAGEGEAALATTRRWLTSDPLHERAHRAVMRTAVALGRREEALQQYRECVAVLDRELGVAPLAETTALHAAILADQPAPAPPPVGPAGTPVARRVPPAPAIGLVDRDDELATLQRAHRGTTDRVGTVVIEGEAGIGKTRIAEEFVEYVTGRGARTAVVGCREGEAGLTCGPLADLLRDAVRVDRTWVDGLAPTVVAEVARVVPELAEARALPLPPVAALDSPGAQVRLLDGVFDALAASVAGPVPGVVVVDDLQWADPTTIDVLARGLHRHRGHPLLLVVTWRSELVGHDHPARRLVRGHDVPVLRPARLTRDQVRELVEDARPTAARLADRLFAETEGIPFFVVQYLAAMEEDGWELPAPVRELVASRLQPLSDLARQCLTAGAVLGRSFDLPTLVRTSGRSEDEVVEAIDELLARGLLLEGPAPGAAGARYDFTHAKVREVVRTSASLARRRLLHRRAAEALVARSGGDPATAARIAQHYEAGGEDELAARHHAAAGFHARSLFANVEALDHLETALALGHDEPATLQRAVGDLHALAGRYAQARTSYLAAAARVTDPTVLAELEHRLGTLHLRWGAWAVAAGHLDRVLGLLADAGNDACLRARARADRAAVTLRLGDAATAAREVEQAVAEAEACGSDQAAAEAHNTAGLIARRRDDLDVADRHLRAALDRAARLDDPAARVAALNNLALVSRSRGRLDEALALADEALTRCTPLGDRHREAALHSNVADLLHAAGRDEEAMTHLKASAARLAEVGGESRDPEVWKLTDW